MKTFTVSRDNVTTGSLERVLIDWNGNILYDGNGKELTTGSSNVKMQSFSVGRTDTVAGMKVFSIP
jgi:hypothetical protein